MPTATKRREIARAMALANPEMTRLEIACLLGVTGSMVSRYLRGVIPARVEQRRPWTKSELEFLEVYAQILPGASIARKLNRTYPAVKRKAHELGLSLRPTLDNYSANFLSTQLGVSSATTTRWIDRGLLKAKRNGRRYWIVKQRDFAAFVRQYPEKVEKVDPEILDWLTGNSCN